MYIYTCMSTWINYICHVASCTKRLDVSRVFSFNRCREETALHGIKFPTVIFFGHRVCGCGLWAGVVLLKTNVKCLKATHHSPDRFQFLMTLNYVLSFIFFNNFLILFFLRWKWPYLYPVCRNFWSPFGTLENSRKLWFFFFPFFSFFFLFFQLFFSMWTLNGLPNY